jgi:hypothetical protein
MSSQPSGRDNAGFHSATGVPRWVKVFLLTAAAIVVLRLVVMVFVGADHGPGRHQSAPAASHRVVETITGSDMR